MNKTEGEVSRTFQMSQEKTPIQSDEKRCSKVGNKLWYYIDPNDINDENNVFSYRFSHFFDQLLNLTLIVIPPTHKTLYDVHLINMFCD